MNRFYITISQLHIGDRIVIPKSKARWIQHHAIFLGFQNGTYWFIENKEGYGVRVISAETLFMNIIEITRTERFVPRWNYTRDDLVRFALSKKGKPYNIVTYNCEHFANEVQHGVAISRQARVGLGLGLLGLGLLVAVASGNRK